MAPATKSRRPKAAGKRPRKSKANRGSPLPDHLLDDVEAPDRSTHNDLEIDGEVLEFIAAIERFKKANGRPFPNWSEVLQIVRAMGYRRA
jgi:hypothetical protein